MRQLTIIISGLLMHLFATAQTDMRGQMPEAIAPIEAPFEMPQLQRPQFAAYRISITETGARPGKQSTKAIQRAIDKAGRRGGGRVVVPEGQWLTGRITLRSNVELHLERGAELHFSGLVRDYQPAVFTRNEGVEMMSLGAMVYADGAENIGITGEGTLVGPGRGCEIDTLEKNDSYLDTYVKAGIPVAERLYDGRKGRRIFRPTFIGLMNCRRVLIESVSLRGSIFWNIVPEYCDSVIIRGVSIDSHGTPRGDAIDIESTRNVLIEYCTVRTTDDAYTMKAGRGEDALRVNRPTENVVIRHCRAENSAGGLAIGTEIGGCVRNIYVKDCVFENVQHGSYMKTNRRRGGGGFNVMMEDVKIVNAKHAFFWDMLGSKKWIGDYAQRIPTDSTLMQVTELTPEFRDITFRNVEATGCQILVKAIGLPERPIRNVLMSGVRAECGKFMELQDVDGFTFRDSAVSCGDNDMILRGVRNMNINNAETAYMK